eukprot:15456776-Alexandrium_andersonii.AAC.1
MDVRGEPACFDGRPTKKEPSQAAVVKKPAACLGSPEVLGTTRSDGPLAIADYLASLYDADPQP